MHIKVSIPGRDEVELQLELDGNHHIQSACLTGVGAPDLLELLAQWRAKLHGDLMTLEPPQGHSSAAILMRELLLKAQGRWDYPYAEQELCHCRAIPTNKVDAAIVTGAHTPEKVSRLTSASTACGTCRPHVEEILEYRLNGPICASAKKVA